ncbi:MAG: 3-deoxy-7-phosphoheptulonate synthase [Bacillota bacterium]
MTESDVQRALTTAGSRDRLREAGIGRQQEAPRPEADVRAAASVPDTYKLTSRRVHTDQTVVNCAGVKIGGGAAVLILGPCSVEGLDMLRETAAAARAGGAAMLRGGAFKPRSSPFSFQGLGRRGLEYLSRVRDEVGLPVVTEVMAPDQVKLVAEHADMLQIGARNMQNFPLLKEAGRQPKPVLLKRGMMSSVSEWLLAAEYIMAHGNREVVLCERGIRTFETATRFTLDISAIPVIRELTHLPVIVDPSHAAGRRDLVPSMCAAALAAGADGLIVEVHPDPPQALCDGPQALQLDQLEQLHTTLTAVAGAVNRTIHAPPPSGSLPSLVGPAAGD